MIADHYAQTVTGVDQASFLTPRLPNRHLNGSSPASPQGAAAGSVQHSSAAAADVAMTVPRCLQAQSSESSAVAAPATHNTADAPNSVNRCSSGRSSTTSSRWTTYLDAGVLRSLGHAVLGVASNADKALMNGKRTSNSNSGSYESGSRRSAQRADKQKKPSAASAPTTPTPAPLSFTPSAARPSSVRNPSRVFTLQPALQPQSDPNAAWVPITATPSTSVSDALATRRWVDAPTGVAEFDDAEQEVEECARGRGCGPASSTAGLSCVSSKSQPECATPLTRTMSTTSVELETEPAATPDAQAEAEDEEAAALVTPHRRAALCPTTPLSGFPLNLATFPFLAIAPRRFGVVDIADELRRCPGRQHPFLDMAHQRRLSDEAAARDHLNYHVVKSFQAQLSDEQQSAALKCLLNAAHRRQFAQCMARTTGDERVMTRKVEPASSASATAQVSSPVFPSGAQAPSDAEHWGPRQRRLIQRQWRVIAEQSECDMYREGWVPVQRKLSCMCLFNPDTDVRIYQDSTTMREQRVARQHRLLRRLHQQQLVGGNPFFLEE